MRDDPFVDRVSASIDSKVSDLAWMEGYMDYYDELEAERRAARMEGVSEGVALGVSKTRLELAAKMVRDGIKDEEGAADFVGVDLADLRQALAELA